MHDFRLKTKPSKPVRDFSNRKSVLLAFMMACMVLLTGRATYLQIFEKDFLQDQGDDRQVDEVVIPAYRGMI